MELTFYTAGWLEGASKKDAIVLVKAIAEKRLNADAKGYYSIIPYQGGMAYELYEGGEGKSFLAPTLEKFKDTPEGVECFTLVKQQNRIIRIDRKRPGLNSVLMPESYVAEDLNMLAIPSGKAIKVQENRVVPAIAGLILAGAGALALTFSFDARITPFEPAAVEITKPLVLDQMPLAYFSELKKIAEEKGVVAKFYLDKTDWKVQIRGTEEVITLKLNKASAPATGAPR